MSKQHDQELEKWWKEETDRLNALAKSAHDKGYTVTVGGKTPDLNPDGTLMNIRSTVKDIINYFKNSS